MDAVWDKFDSHKTPFYLKKDYSFMEVSTLSGIGATAENMAQTMSAVAKHMTAHAATMPHLNDGVDITTLTESEAIAYLTGGSVSGIGSNIAAFTLPQIIMDGGIDGIGANIFQKAGAAVKKVVTQAADAIKAALQKMLNWVFKEGLKKAGPFFLFSFIQRAVSQRVDAKRVKQQKIISWVSKVTGTSEAVVMASIADGIKTATGKTPQEALNAAANGEKVAGIGEVGSVIVVVTLALEVIQKLIAFFKKNKAEAPSVDASGASDVNELTEDARAQPVANENAGIIPANVPRMADKIQDSKNRDIDPNVENGGALVTKADVTAAAATGGGATAPAKDNSMLMWGGAALVGLYLLSQNKK